MYNSQTHKINAFDWVLRVLVCHKLLKMFLDGVNCELTSTLTSGVVLGTPVLNPWLHLRISHVPLISKKHCIFLSCSTLIIPFTIAP